jgi:hypothetical protein
MSVARLQTSRNGFADTIQGFGFRASLGDAARNRRAFGYEHAGLVWFQRHKKPHTWILLHEPPTMEFDRSALLMQRDRV